MQEKNSVLQNKIVKEFNEATKKLKLYGVAYSVSFLILLFFGGLTLYFFLYELNIKNNLNIFFLILMIISFFSSLFFLYKSIDYFLTPNQVLNIDFNNQKLIVNRLIKNKIISIKDIKYIKVPEKITLYKFTYKIYLKNGEIIKIKYLKNVKVLLAVLDLFK